MKKISWNKFFKTYHANHVPFVTAIIPATKVQKAPYKFGPCQLIALEKLLDSRNDNGFNVSYEFECNQLYGVASTYGKKGKYTVRSTITVHDASKYTNDVES